MSNGRLNVVGLLSGGKDSCYNLCHCVKQGHRIAALATLAPPQGTDELDSYMYQTVGHDAVHLIAEAMELPLYRVTITGQAINQTSSYGHRLASSSLHTLDSSDETEDLFGLLQKVKSAHPEVDAVSVGAILSNYQRVRVEHVALRAGLKMLPLSYLWQRDQRELLDEMCQAGLDSILIKTAGAGLGEDDLGKSLVKMRPKLHKLHHIYGAHICGEGGEYETFTLDCPLFKKRIVIDKTTTVVHSDSSFASVFYLQINAAHLEEKEPGSLHDVAVPPLLDPLGTFTRHRCEEAGRGSAEIDKGRRLLLSATTGRSVARRGHWCAFGGLAGSASTTIEEEFIAVFDILMDELRAQLLSPAHLVHLNVYLSSQGDFATLNKVYQSYFGVDPPSRACIGINLSEQSACHLILDAVAFDDGVDYSKQSSLLPPPPKLRKVLHVQGRSYWAAANIGPYSQSVNTQGRITIAGQIGLVPATLQLARPPSLEIALSLQHARRVFKATLEGRAEKQRGWMEGCICWIDDVQWLNAARRAWQAQSSHNDDVLAWEADWLGAGLAVKDIPVAFVILLKGALPRSASVEWQLFAHDGQGVFNAEKETDADGNEDVDDYGGEAPTPTAVAEIGSLGGFEARWRTISSKEGASALGIMHLTRGNGTSSHVVADHFLTALSLKVLYHDQDDLDILQALTRHLTCAVTFVPVSACYDGQLRGCNATLIWQSVGHAAR